MNTVPQEISYFAEWGGSTWQSLVGQGLSFLQQEGGLQGAHVLDIGTRYGKMALLFAAEGAHATGIDINQAALAMAADDARTWRTRSLAAGAPPAGDAQFLAYSGSLDVFADESFDVVFTKSVLVLVPQLEPFLQAIGRKLKAGGRIVFIENGRGNPLLHSLRAVRHRHWDYRGVHYFTRREAELVRSIFDVERVEQTAVPPIYLFLGRKRLPSASRP